MKTKVIFAFMALSMVLASCNRDEKNLFDQSASERARMAIDSAKAYLPATANGWDMVYFANTGAEGYHVLLKFDENGQVVAAAKNAKTTKNKYAVDSTSVWAVQMDYGPILTFNTYNDVMHAWADPRNDGDGYSGDYEFLILESNPDYFKLKGKKHSAYCYLRPMPADVEWEAYLDDLSKQRTAAVGNGNLFIYEEGGVQKGLVYQVDLNADGAFIQSANVTGIFCISGMDQPCDPEAENVYPYAILDEGLQLQFGVGDNRKTVVYNQTNDAFVADNGSRFVIGNLNLYAGRYLQFGKRSWNIKSTNGEMCPAMADARQRLETYLKNVSSKAALQALTISYVTSTSIYDADSVYVSIKYTSNGNNSNTVSYRYDMTYNEEGFSLQYIGPKYTKSGQGEQVYEKFDGVKDMLEAINGEYVMTTENSINPANGSLLSKKGDANTWFDITGAK